MAARTVYDRYDVLLWTWGILKNDGVRSLLGENNIETMPNGDTDNARR